MNRKTKIRKTRLRTRIKTRRVRRGGLRGGTTPALEKELEEMRRNNSRRALFNNAIKLKQIDYNLEEFLNKIGLNKPSYNSLSDVQKKYINYQHRKFMASMLNGNSINGLKKYYEYYYKLLPADKVIEDQQYTQNNE